MKIYDEYLKQEIEVQQEITPEIGKEIQLEEPKEFQTVIEEEEQ